MSKTWVVMVGVEQVRGGADQRAWVVARAGDPFPSQQDKSVLLNGEGARNCKSAWEIVTECSYDSDNSCRPTTVVPVVSGHRF